MLRNNNSNKLPSDLREICIYSHLLQCALEVCKRINDEYVASEHDSAIIVNAGYNHNVLPVVPDVFQGLMIYLSA